MDMRRIKTCMDMLVGFRWLGRAPCGTCGHRRYGRLAAAMPILGSLLAMQLEFRMKV